MDIFRSFFVKKRKRCRTPLQYHILGGRFWEIWVSHDKIYLITHEGSAIVLRFPPPPPISNWLAVNWLILTPFPWKTTSSPKNDPTPPLTPHLLPGDKCFLTWQLFFEDINRCTNDSKVCGVNARCIKTDYSYGCTCKEGVTRAGGFCSGKLILEHQKCSLNSTKWLLTSLKN